MRSPENCTLRQPLAGAAGLHSTRARIFTQSSENPRSDVEVDRGIDTSSSGSNSLPVSTSALPVRGAVGGERLLATLVVPGANCLRVEPLDEERPPQTPVPDIPSRQRTSGFGAGVRASNDILGYAAPPFMKQPTTKAQQTDPSGRTPSSLQAAVTNECPPRSYALSSTISTFLPRLPSTRHGQWNWIAP